MIYDVLKRIIDIVGAILGIIVFSPIFIGTAIAIKVNSRGPILADTPMRVGKNGRLFYMYKFRSMVVGAAEILKQNPELFKKYKENSYKLDINEDPRITKVGRFIRKTSIDEFPQFLNVLKGEMSLVGPRAYYPFELEDQQKKYPNSREFVKIILSAKPGLTGVWQVSGRSNINFDKRVEMDARYVQRRSIFYDMYIILKTVPAVLTSRGAV
jgi:lipopolysaccharide/colanic/teichoic acid biosynthesis glycosyltransferase